MESYLHGRRYLEPKSIDHLANSCGAWMCPKTSLGLPQGLKNVCFWEFSASFSRVCWRLHALWLGDVQLGHGFVESSVPIIPMVSHHGLY